MIIWLASYPRSGNTYFRMLLYHCYGIKTYSVYNDPLFEKLGASEVVGHQLLPAPIEDLIEDNGLYFIKTHDLPTDNNPAIYIIRDGRDALISYTNYILSFKKRYRLFGLLDFFDYRKFQKTLRSLIVYSERYGGWSENAFSWTKKRKNGLTFVTRYEDLVDDPFYWVKKSLESLNIKGETLAQNMPDFESLHKKWPNFFRKGKIGVWQKEMPEELIELFWKHHSNAMETFGYNKT